MLFHFYLADVNSAAPAGSGDSVGTIVFKKRSATRKTASSLGWARLRNASPVFGADTLRTADRSEASLIFSDGTSLDLLDNTMIKVDFGAAGRVLEFVEGAIELGGNAAAAETTVRIGDSTLSADAAASLSLTGTGSEVKVEVASGAATVLHADGTSSLIRENQEARIDVASGAVAVRDLELIPRSPRQNERFISSAGGATDIPFSFSLLNGSEGESYVQLARDEGFTEIVAEVPATSAGADGLMGASLSLEDGTWYWRARHGDGTFSNFRRLTLNREQPVSLNQPADGIERPYRKKAPVIRFSWGEAPGATAYVLELSRDPSFSAPEIRTRTVVSSLSVGSLLEGRWYWRVVPDYPFRRVGPETAPAYRSFSVSRREAMAAPTPSYPGNGTLFQIQEVSTGLSFSWVAEPEAVRYELALSASRDLSNPVALLATASPYLHVSEGLSPLSAAPGTWYWGVRWKDDEGNLSPFSRPSTLNGIDGSMAIRLSYPPDGYVVADSLVRNLRFSWKTNVPARTVFQVSRDREFSDLAAEEDVVSETALGGDWKVGTYYWRLRTYNADGVPFLETPVRSFSVADPFPAPVLIQPDPRASFMIRSDDERLFEWKTPPGADYVRLDLIREGESEPRVSLPALSASSVTLPLGTLPDGRYRVRLQGFGLDKESSSRIIGYAEEFPVAFRTLTFARLVSPADGAEIDGLSAIRSGVALGWENADTPDRAELLISRDPSLKDPLYRNGSPARTDGPGRLPEGTYYWTVRNYIDAFDVSAKETYRFTVTPVPLLAAPALLGPADGTVLDPPFLRGHRELLFEWEAVNGANRYAFNLFKAPGGKPVLTVQVTEPRFLLTDLASLSRGGFFWTVEARGVGAGGYVEQEGIQGRSGFSVDIPALTAPSIDTPRTSYGF